MQSSSNSQVAAIRLPSLAVCFKISGSLSILITHSRMMELTSSGSSSWGQWPITDEPRQSECHN
ncbi:hypothetical protein Hanom_Chr05g00420521 [Helianthus anomalus]